MDIDMGSIKAQGGQEMEEIPLDAVEEPAQEAVTQPRNILFCRGKKVSHGRDLGVWESSLEDKAHFFSRLTLSYLAPLLDLGARKVLDADDIGVPSQQDEAKQAFSRALAAWEHETAKTSKRNEKARLAYQGKLDKCTSDDEREKIRKPKYSDPSIAFALCTAFGSWKILLASLYYIISAVLGFVPVLILNDLVKFFESGQSVSEYNSYVNLWVEVAALGLIPVIVSLMQTINQTTMAHCAVFTRTAVSTLLYRKALRVSPQGRASTSTGQVVNMMSNDTAQLQLFLQFLGMILASPVQIVVALVLIYQQVGHATWVGIGYSIALLPVNALVMSTATKQRRRVLTFSDARVKMMNEILSGIRIIKFYAWERAFGREVSSLRDSELAALTRLSFTQALGFNLILMSAPLIQPILVFLTYVSIQREPLSASTAFTTVALFNMMRMPFAFLPMGMLQYVQSRISLRRLERYLDFPELAEYVEPTPPPGTQPGDPSALEGSVTIQSGHFGWIDPDAKPIRQIQEQKSKKEDRHRTSASENDTDMRSTIRNPFILKDITCTIPAGSLVAVVGSVGSGKTSLLSAILGEMIPLQNSKVFVPQPANAPSGYLSYCSQTPWVVNDTIRGNILFGREFVRERYDAIIDACALSDDLAVLPVGDLTEIGEKGINISGGQKARISLARALYSRDTKLVLLDDPLSAVDAHVGEHIFANAIAGDLVHGITRVLVTHHVHLLSRCDSVIVLEHGRIMHHGNYKELLAKGIVFAGAHDVSSEPEISTQKIHEEREDTVDSVFPAEKKITAANNKPPLKQTGNKLVMEEERAEGSVGSSTYLHYAIAGGLRMAFCVLVAQSFGTACDVYSGFWLARWAKKSVEAMISGDPFSTVTTNRYLGIYALFGLLGVFGLTMRSVFIAIHRLGASRRLYTDVTESVLRAPVAFFDVTPTGRILNRFAADTNTIDLQLMQSVNQGISTVFSVLGAVVVMIVATNGTLLIPFIPISYLYYKIQKWFRKSFIELQRINSIANSPIFANFSQTLSGTSTIRAYGEETRFFEHCQQSFDTMNASYILVQLTNYWLGLRLDVLGGVISACVGGIALATYSSGFISAGWLGLALSNSIQATTFLKTGSSVYTNSIDSEAPEYVPEKDPSPGTWPVKGDIELSHMSMRYRDGPLVIRDISLRVLAGEKVGICGRTGSGKSSLMVALFRISEVERDGGKIVIDNVDIGEIGTFALRSNLSIIPQDPILFSNTVRYNLDPFERSTDEELWDVLQKVQMAEVVATLPHGLQAQVSEGGENFSQGQRQLLCIARSLLRKPKIMVLDEATASIDNVTDSVIQSMIRENFSGATVLTIAHRLNTIMDSDRVLVLDNGRVAEYDSPQALLAREGSLFRAMVERSRRAAKKSKFLS